MTTCSFCQNPNPESARYCAACGRALGGAGGPDEAREAREGSSAAEPESVDPSVGLLLGDRYRILRKLGEGGMGVVYEALQQVGEVSRRVAIKMLLPSLSADPTVVSRFRRECAIISELKHPNTVRFFDFGETTDGGLYVVMELVEGRSLGDVILAGPLSLERTQRILTQVAGALSEAHDRGIVHRDLKPDNIVLTRHAGQDDWVKLLDFGIAKRESQGGDQRTKLTKQGMIIGTLPYMSPEQLTGKAVGPKSDIYALGVIAYEMLTGRLPFEAETSWEWARKHLVEEPLPLETQPPTQTLPEYARAAVLRALAKDPELRPRTALEFSSALSGAAVLSTVPGTPPPSGAPRPEEPVGPGHTVPGMPAMAEMAGPPRPVWNAPAAPGGIGVSAVGGLPGPPRRAPSRIALALGGSTLLLAAVGLALALSLRERPDGRNDEGRPGATFPGSSAGPTGTEAAPPVTLLPEAVGSEVVPPESPLGVDAGPRQTVPRPQPPSPTKPPRPQVPSASPSAPSTPQVPPVSVPQGDAACYDAVAAANSLAIENAVQRYRDCERAGGSAAALAAAKAAIRSQAAVAVRQRASAGDCSGALRAVRSAKTIGAGGSAQLAYNRSTCSAQDDGSKPDTPKPDTPKPDTPKPDTPKPDTPKPDTPKPDTSKPDTSKPDTPTSGTPGKKRPKSRPDTPDSPKPDAPKPVGKQRPGRAR